MKGKKTFTKQHAEEIRKLLKTKMNKGKSEQKKIRDTIRDLGFYISDFNSSTIPFTVNDFDQLIKDGKITIIKPCFLKKLFLKNIVF